jgi:hypothetical protein
MATLCKKAAQLARIHMSLLLIHQIVKEPLIGLPAEAGPPIATARGRSHQSLGILNVNDFSCPVKGGNFPDWSRKKPLTIEAII